MAQHIAFIPHFRYTISIRATCVLYFYSITTMSQDKLIRLVSEGDAKGVGKGHTIYTFKNKKKHPDKLQFKKFNPVARVHTLYKEKK